MLFGCAANQQTRSRRANRQTPRRRSRFSPSYPKSVVDRIATSKYFAVAIADPSKVGGSSRYARGVQYCTYQSRVCAFSGRYCSRSEFWITLQRTVRCMYSAKLSRLEISSMFYFKIEISCRSFKLSSQPILYVQK